MTVDWTANRSVHYPNWSFEQEYRFIHFPCLDLGFRLLKYFIFFSLPVALASSGIIVLLAVN